MALESDKLREALRPQDAFAALIMLLGIAIAFFLEGAAIKLIGGSIALLGGVALYMTIAQRVNDQVQLRTRRSTLPPPSFKTTVTQDSSSGTTRIKFDDFQDSFDPGDDEPVERERPAMTRQVPQRPSFDTEEGTIDEGFRVITPGEAGSGAGHQGRHAEIADANGRTPLESPQRATAGDDNDDDADELGADPQARFASADEGSFRIVKPSRSARKNIPERSPDRDRSPSERSTANYEPSPPPAGTTQNPPQTSSPAADTPRPQPQTLSGAAHPSPVAVHQPVAESPEGSGMRQHVQMILEDLATDPEDDTRGGEPRAEFVRLVGQVLNAIARSISARSILFCWVNLEKGHLIPEASIGGGSARVNLGTRIKLGNDVISQIARNASPEILTDISPAVESELVPYYERIADTRSFVGVPVFFRREVVGVLAADSSERNGFDESSVAVMAEYTRLIAGLIRGYTEKYDLQLTARTLEGFENLHRELTGASRSPRDVARALIGQLARLVDHRYAAAVLFDAEQNRWSVVAAVENDSPDAGQLVGKIEAIEPDMDNSLAGYSTRFAEEIDLESIGTDVRIAPGEKLGEGGAFVAIPLVGTTKCYGAVMIEHDVAAAYIPRDLELIRDLVRYASLAIEVYNINRAIENHSVLDEVSGLYNTEFLLSMLDREILRARDYQTPLAFVLVSIDIPESLGIARSSELEEYVVASVGASVAASVRPYDVVGRFNGRTFGVVLANRTDQDAFLWAERLRKEMAGRILSAGGRKFAVTISAGVCDMSESASSSQIIDGATQALERARTGDGNAVILY